MPFPNASLLLEARKKEYQTAIDAENSKTSCLVKLKDDMESSGSDTKLLYDKFCDFLNTMDDIRLELKVIGGEHCSIKLKEITETRNSIFENMTKVFVEFDSSFTDMMEKLRINYDSTYDEMTKNNMFQLKYIDPVEIPSYVLTLSDEDLISLKEYVSKDEMFKHLSAHMLDVLLDDEESKEIYRKIELLG